MKSWNKKHYVIPREYNERGNPQNKNFLMDAHVSPLGFLCMTQNFWTVFVLKHMKKILLLSLLITQPTLAYYTDNIPNKCGLMPEMFTVFTINQYTCPAGEFLPAYTLGCRACPIGYTCNGGTYNFNDDIFQGAIKQSGYINNNLSNLCSTNAPHELSAVMTPNKHTCSPGYYLPANVDSCTICPQNNKCTGGTYSFNETTNQGIEQCISGHAPVGSSICYEHILHIGDDVVYLKSTKLTTPSLNVGMDDGIFYANMTTTPTRMNAATDHYLKIEYDGMIYYVCDDTTYGK